MRAIVFADDLTGANGTAAFLRREGMRARVHLGGSFAESGQHEVSVSDDNDQSVGRAGAWLDSRADVVDLETRNLGDSLAAIRVTRAVNSISAWPELFGLRLDSTLRGPVVPSLEVVLSVLADSMAFIVPAFPDSGRITKDAIHYVHGVPVGETMVANDPVCPVTVSDIRQWIGEKLNHSFDWISLDTVKAGSQAVVDQVAFAEARGGRVILCDAVSNIDLHTLAAAAKQWANSSGKRVIPVDPGPFTAAFAATWLRSDTLHPDIFGISGSIMDSAKAQMESLTEDDTVTMVCYEGQTVDEILAAFAAAPAQTVTLMLRTDRWQKSKFEEDDLSDVLQQVFVRVVEQFPSLRGFYLSGGETAGIVLEGAGIRSLEMEGEIAPLTPLTRMGPGPLQGRWLVTKGGAVGDAAAVVQILARLRDVLAES